ncbi:MAG: energy transducer TonB [Bacteroidia bacterium]
MLLLLFNFSKGQSLVQYNSFSDALKNKDSLKRVVIVTDNLLNAFTKKWEKTSNLIELEINCDEIKDLPTSFNELNELKSLKLIGDNIVIPEYISELNTLEKIVIESTGSFTFKASLVNFPSLKEIVVEGAQYNNYDYLLESLKEVNKPVKLFLINDNEKESSDYVNNYNEKFDGLKLLLKSPANTNIKTAHLINPNFQTLWIESVVIVDVNFTQLVNLEVFHAYQMYLINTEGLSNAQNLKTLYIKKCMGLKEFPADILKLKSLRSLTFEKNKVYDIPLDLCDMGLNKIYVETKDKSELPCNQYKIGSDEDVNKEPIFMVVEDKPEFPGGIEAMFRYLKENIVYPTNEKKLGIQGVSYVKFVIDKDGTISNVGIYPGTENKGTESMHKEAIRVISTMPKWNPGKQGGKAVRCSYFVPVRFR